MSKKNFSFSVPINRRIYCPRCYNSSSYDTADKYISHVESYNGVVDKDFDNLSLENENGFLWDSLNLEDKKLADGKLVKVNGSEVGL